MARFAKTTAPPPAAAQQQHSGNSSSAPGSWRFRCANFYTLIILFSVPLFSVPCSKGTCTTPVEVVAAFLHTQGLLGEGIAKVIIYPGAILNKAEAVMADNQAFTLPDWDTLLQDFKVSRQFADGEQYSSVKNGLFGFGCFLCLVGATLSVLGPSLISAFGMLTLLWYIYEEGKNRQDVYALPMFGLAILCSFAAFNFDWVSSKQSSLVAESPETESQSENKKSL
ncbi:hypothetical protein O6H91_06G058500 [Diphasiastrum complanatum]|uniref:Uncharacterized protein n=1 Tax=Diphasiastrum complanatum TaxID=34168 RepID=A0ACC2DE44_DIPCM|nr:hypothetical protein O6H91_06G058500 [Diphasiastrum complanatum]